MHVKGSDISFRGGLLINDDVCNFLTDLEYLKLSKTTVTPNISTLLCGVQVTFFVLQLDLFIPRKELIF